MSVSFLLFSRPHFNCETTAGLSAPDPDKKRNTMDETNSSESGQNLRKKQTSLPASPPNVDVSVGQFRCK